MAQKFWICNFCPSRVRSIEYFPQGVSLKLRHPSRGVTDRTIVFLAGRFSRDRDESGESEYFVALRVRGVGFHQIEILRGEVESRQDLVKIFHFAGLYQLHARSYAATSRMTSISTV